MMSRLWSLLWVDVEAKVKAAGTAAFVSSALLAVLSALYGHDVPAMMVTVVDALVPGVPAWLAGWLAKHTPRAEPGTAQAVA